MKYYIIYLYYIIFGEGGFNFTIFIFFSRGIRKKRGESHEDSGRGLILLVGRNEVN